MLECKVCAERREENVLRYNALQLTSGERKRKCIALQRVTIDTWGAENEMQSVISPCGKSGLVISDTRLSTTC